MGLLQISNRLWTHTVVGLWLLTGLLLSGWTKMSTIKKLQELHSVYTIMCLCEVIHRIGFLEFTFAYSTALPTVLAINRVWFRCQCCCSLVSSAYSRLYSNQVRLWPSPCKVSPFWKWIYFGLVLWVAPSAKMACSQRGHIPQPRLYFLILHDRGAAASAWQQITVRCEGWAKWESLMNCLNH